MLWFGILWLQCLWDSWYLFNGVVAHVGCFNFDNMSPGPPKMTEVEGCQGPVLRIDYSFAPVCQAHLLNYGTRRFTIRLVGLAQMPTTHKHLCDTILNVSTDVD